MGAPSKCMCRCGGVLQPLSPKYLVDGGRGRAPMPVQLQSRLPNHLQHASSLAVLILLLCMHLACSSEGDQQLDYRKCWHVCLEVGCVSLPLLNGTLPAKGAYCDTACELGASWGGPQGTVRKPTPLSLRLTRWSCDGRCRLKDPDHSSPPCMCPPSLPHLPHNSNPSHYLPPTHPCTHPLPPSPPPCSVPSIPAAPPSLFTPLALSPPPTHPPPPPPPSQHTHRPPN